MNIPSSQSSKRALGRRPWPMVLLIAAMISASGAEVVHAFRPGFMRTRIHFFAVQEAGIDPEQQAVVEPVLPKDLRVWLEQVGELEARDDLNGAREHLSGLMASDVYFDLLAGDDKVVLAGLDVLDERAKALSLSRVQLVVREERVQRFSAFLAVRDPDMLAAELKLAATRYALGDLEGAHALLEMVHSLCERFLPLDDPLLLRAKTNLAATRKDLGDIEGALELEELVHNTWERLLPPDHPDLLAIKLNLAQTLKAIGDLQGALDLEEWVHSAQERLLPADHPDLLRAKLNLALTLGDLGDLQGALELEELVHSVREDTLPPDHPDLLSAKTNLASTLYALGDLQGALELQKLVHSARERLLPPDHPDLLSAKSSLASTLYALGDLEASLELYELVHSTRERILPPDHLDLLHSKVNLANLRYSLGDLEGAHQLDEAVHSAWERLLPPDHPDLLRAKQNLAVTRGRFGDLEGALKLIEEVHDVQERLLSPDHPDLLSARHNLAAARKDLGDFEGALELFERVHNAWERLLPADHPNLLSTKLNLAGTRKALGDVEGALELEEVVHVAWERLLSPDHPELLSIKQNLANTRRARGDLEGALELAQWVYNSRERLLPPDHPDRLESAANFAGKLGAIGDFESALKLQELVHNAYERLLPPDHPFLLSAKSSLAGTRHTLGDLEGSLELDELVHSARERLLPPDHPDLLDAKVNLAGSRKALGDLEGALEMFLEVLAGQEIRAHALRSVAPRVARAAAKSELQRLSSCLFLNRSDDSSHGSALEPKLFRVLELFRSVSIGLGAAMRAAAERPELARVLNSLERAREAVADHRLSQPARGNQGDSSEVDAWRAELLRLAENRDGLEKQMRTKLADAGFDPISPTAERVAASLKPGAMLIDFWRYTRNGNRDQETGKYPPVIDSLLAFVVTADGNVNQVELGPSAELEDLALNWRKIIGKPVGHERGSIDEDEERGVGIVAAAADDNFEARLGAELRTRLLDPCLALLGDAAPTELHLILDDFLHLLPIDALPWTDGKRLGEVFPVQQETSAQRLAENHNPYQGDGILLALGDVDFRAEGDGEVQVLYSAATPPTGAGFREERSSRRGSFGPLIYTRFEVEVLERLHGSLTDGESLVLTKGDASKRALFAHAPSARYLHLATHGWFAPEAFVSTIESREVQSGDTHAGLSRADVTVRGFAPETLCGLALAGANNGVNSAGKVPGIITAEELGALDLSGCELAVLSACETNVGLRRAGQGIQSLQMALHTAGARTAITSLWRVGDAATMRLMELFYTKLWGDKLGKADALWQAKMALREEGFGIKDWAAWVLTGDPR